MNFKCFVFLGIILECGHSARILGVFPSPGYSQYILGSSLMKALAARGHYVVVISPFKQNNPIENYEEIVVEEVREIFKGLDIFEMQSASAYQITIMGHQTFGFQHTEMILNNQKVRDLLKSDAQFDLVIKEHFFNEAHMGFAYHFRAPLILLTTTGVSEWTSNLVGHSFAFSVTPTTFSEYTDTMNFKERLRNTLFGFFDNAFKHLVAYRGQNKILKKYFPDAPDIKELLYNVSLLLLNSNFGVSSISSLLPNMIEIGGFHITPNDLPIDLKTFLDQSSNGVIYFSLGSVINPQNFTGQINTDILECFASLNQNVLWKWKELPNVPNNVKIGKWFPQQDVLAHPNVRLFISHGGLNSVTEAVHYGIPIIGIPMFSDGRRNMAVAISKGYGLKIPFKSFTKQTLCAAINEILTNSTYRTRAQIVSRILKDQPMKPLEKAIFWIEYVIRNNGAKFLRPSSLNLNWLQYYLIDVVACILLIGCFSILMVILVFKLLFAKKKGKLRVKKD